MAIETQHYRTQLAWTRTGLSMVAVGLVEVRLLVGPDPGRALLALGIAAALVVLLGTAAALRLRRNADALEADRTRAGGRAPAIIAGASVLVGVLGLATVIAGPRI